VILYCATTNPGKLREFQLAAPAGIDVTPLPGLNEIDPPEEAGATFRDNAVLKAEYYSKFAPDGACVFADDSGLAVDALGGAPGVQSARYAGPGATDAANNALLIARMKSEPNRSARFVCVIAQARANNRQDGLIETFDGVVEGMLLDAPRGAGGFGYDPLFYYPPFGCTLAEATPEQKLSVSHRGAALAAMFRWLRARAESP
jgi:XTP/dITP diphosphohydrolase